MLTGLQGRHRCGLLPTVALSMTIRERQVARAIVVTGGVIQDCISGRYVNCKVAVVDGILTLVEQNPGVGWVIAFAEFSGGDVVGILPDAGTIHITVHGHAPNPTAFVPGALIRNRVLHVGPNGAELTVLRADEELRIEAVRFVSRLIRRAQPARDPARVLRIFASLRGVVDRGQVIFVIRNKGDPTEMQLAEVAQALRALRARFHAAQHRQKQGGEYADDGDDNEEFDERKCAPPQALRGFGELAAGSRPHNRTSVRAGAVKVKFSLGIIRHELSMNALLTEQLFQTTATSPIQTSQPETLQD